MLDVNDDTFIASTYRKIETNFIWMSHLDTLGRDYCMQCDRPSHLLRIMKGKACHKTLVHSSLSLPHFMLNYWLFYKSNSSTKQKNNTDILYINVEPEVNGKLEFSERLQHPEHPVRNLSRLQAWCSCQLSCKQPGLVLSSCITAGTNTHTNHFTKKII